jgi:hypothetical protein
MRRFASSQAIGGHYSKVHPGMSSVYTHKVKRRNERVQERKILAAAKERFYKKFGSNAMIDRTRIRKYKKEIRLSMASGGGISS